MWRVGDVLLAAPDAVGEPAFDDFVVGAIANQDIIEKTLSVRYEHEPWRPKQGGALLHKSSIKIGTWAQETIAGGTAFRIDIVPDIGSILQQLATAEKTAEEAEKATVKLIKDIPGRARELLKQSVMTSAKRRRTVIDVDETGMEPGRPTLGVEVNRRMQARLSEVKDELVDAQEDYGPVVTQNQIQMEELDELRALALSHGIEQQLVDAIKLKYQRKLAQSNRLPPSADTASTQRPPTESAAVPRSAEIGRRLEVFWADESKWFGGVLAKIEPGHDDGGDSGDYQILYDDGDEQWEPLGSRTSYRWVDERPESVHGSIMGATLPSAGSVPTPAQAPAPVRQQKRPASAITSPPLRAVAASNSTPPTTSTSPTETPLPKTYEDFERSGFYHLNSLKTEEWAANENVAFIPFITERAATPYFGDGEQDYVNAVTSGTKSYKEVRGILMAHGGYSPNTCTQLATWLMKVRPGAYLVMRHNNEDKIFATGTRPARAVYVIGRVTLTHHPGSIGAQEIANRLEKRFLDHPNYPVHSIYGPHDGSEEYTVEWFKLGFTDELKEACAEFQPYLNGQQTKTLSDHLCKMGMDADKNAKYRKILYALWSNAKVDLETNNTEALEAQVRQALGTTRGIVDVD